MFINRQLTVFWKIALVQFIYRHYLVTYLNFSQFEATFLLMIMSVFYYKSGPKSTSIRLQEDFFGAAPSIAVFCVISKFQPN